MKKTALVSSIFFFISFQMTAQLSDIARVDYTVIPGVRSDVEFTRSRFLFNAPIRLKGEETFLLIGLDYRNIHLRFDNEDLAFDTEVLNDFQILDFNIGFTQPLTDDWRFGLRLSPGISTNLTAKDLSFEDVVFSADILFIKERKIDAVKKERLIIGASYSGNRGFNFPLPFISFYRKWNPKWSFNIGIPKTNLQYHFSSKHRLKTYLELDGFTSNVQNGVVITDRETATSINMSLILGGFQYEYHLTKHWQLYARTAYIFSIRNNLRNKDRENVYTIDNESTAYLRTGIRFKI
ncbi:MAG: hypothetical protein ACI828_001787 [Flavobacteriales bacterium]|jgi:hypothetical protein